MGRKKKKNHKSAQKVKEFQPLDQQAAEHLSAGRFRQAVDAYKELLKKGPETYRPHLRSAYEGLYKQRLEKGMLKEAAMVLDQIEKLTGNLAGADRIRLWLKSQAFAKAAAAQLAFLACLHQRQVEAAGLWYQRAHGSGIRI